MISVPRVVVVQWPIPEKAEAEIKAEMPRPAWRLAKDLGAQERELRRPGPLLKLVSSITIRRGVRVISHSTG